MKIRSIEPTPSPNVMKINMNETIQEGLSQNYTKENIGDAPEYIQRIFQIDGIQGVFQVNDFIAVERHSKAHWQVILKQVGNLFGEESNSDDSQAISLTGSFGEVNVYIQMFKGIPMQVKLTTENEEMRFALPERFGKSVMSVQNASKNLLLEREWINQGVRYGSFQEIGEDVVAELGATFDRERVEQLVSHAIGEKEKESSNGVDNNSQTEEKESLLDHPDWEKRFAALDKMNPTVEDLPVLGKALNDTKMSIRRLATAYLGMIEEEEALPYLYKALKDTSPAVRRTAGDALSDIGNPLAISVMSEALQDSNKLVRWRAARFMYEVGDETAIEALELAQEDPEFEVSLQAKMALERIKRGEEASGTVWQQMTKTMKKDENE
jgi:hypothetical protein